MNMEFDMFEMLRTVENTERPVEVPNLNLNGVLSIDEDEQFANQESEVFHLPMEPNNSDPEYQNQLSLNELEELEVRRDAMKFMVELIILINKALENENLTAPVPMQPDRATYDMKSNLWKSTVELLNFVKNSEETKFGVQELSQKLGVKKRRIYDILHVFESVGYCQKLAVDLYQFGQNQNDAVHSKKLDEISKEVEDLEFFENSLDSLVEGLQMFLGPVEQGRSEAVNGWNHASGQQQGSTRYHENMSMAEAFKLAQDELL